MKNSRFNLIRAGLITTATMLPFLAEAHHLPGESKGFISGMSHPLHGLDHILAMVAVGLWAAQLGRKALWAVPSAFVALMVTGGVLGVSGAHLPMVETGIALSILVLGLLITTAARLPLFGNMALVGFFALFHGFAHGAEMPSTASTMNYFTGFALSTAFLHVGGIALGIVAQKRIAIPSVRFAGAVIAIAGLMLWMGL